MSKKSSYGDSWTLTQAQYCHYIAEQYENLPVAKQRVAYAVKDMLEYLDIHGFLDRRMVFTDSSVYHQLWIANDASKRRYPNEKEQLAEWGGDKEALKQWKERLYKVVQRAMEWRGGKGQFEERIYHWSFNIPEGQPLNSAATPRAPPAGAREELLGLPAPGASSPADQRQVSAGEEYYSPARAPINIYEGESMASASQSGTAREQLPYQYYASVTQGSLISPSVVRSRDQPRDYYSDSNTTGALVGDTDVWFQNDRIYRPEDQGPNAGVPYWEDINEVRHYDYNYDQGQDNT